MHNNNTMIDRVNKCCNVCSSWTKMLRDCAAYVSLPHGQVRFPVDICACAVHNDSTMIDRVNRCCSSWTKMQRDCAAYVPLSHAQVRIPVLFIAPMDNMTWHMRREQMCTRFCYTSSEQYATSAGTTCIVWNVSNDVLEKCNESCDVYRNSK